jgi:hypothetical protein
MIFLSGGTGSLPARPARRPWNLTLHDAGQAHPAGVSIMSRRTVGSSDDSPSLETLRDAALKCLDLCAALSAWAKNGEEAWTKAHQEGVLQAFLDGLEQAIEAGKGIEHEPRLTLATPYKFGSMTARNAHMAALLLAGRMRPRILEAAATYKTLAAEEVRAVVYPVFGYTALSSGGFSPVPYDFGALRETIAWEADRAQQGVTTHPERRKLPSAATRRDKWAESRDKWIYEQCLAGTAYDRIVTKLKTLAVKRKWKIVSTKQRIQQIGNEYAERNGMEKPPPRQNL